MKKLLLAVGVISLLAAGCDGIMTNDEVIKETKKCREAGMKIRVIRSSEGYVYDVNCDPT